MVAEPIWRSCVHCSWIKIIVRFQICECVLRSYRLAWVLVNLFRQEVSRLFLTQVVLPWPNISQVHGLARRSEEHTSELQSPCNLVCRLLLEKKKQQLLI